MAKAKKSTVKRAKAGATRRLSSSSVRCRNANVGRTVIGLAVGAMLIVGIAFVATMGYRSAIASKFFDISTIDIRGTDRSSAEDIRRIVKANSERAGVWQTDIAAIREKIEKLPFVRSAAVSMALPAGIRVSVIERVPVAIIRTQGGDQLVDAEGVLLAPAVRPEPNIPFAMRGWDESKTATAMPDNLARLKLYRRMLDDWREFAIADRVKEVNLADMREPAATIEDSGRAIGVVLAKDNLAKGLKAALEAVAGKGEKIRSVNANGVYPVLNYIY